MRVKVTISRNTRTDIAGEFIAQATRTGHTGMAQVGPHVIGDAARVGYWVDRLVAAGEATGNRVEVDDQR